MPQGYAFNLTYGRSGSTILQKILNTIDGYKILGENYNALYDLFRSCVALRKTHGSWPNGPAPLPWLGASEIDPGGFEKDVVAAFIEHILRPEPTARVVGFKEIRFPIGSDADMLDFLNFIETYFPNSKIIFNVRNAEDVAKSSWRRNSEPERVFKMVARADGFFRGAVEASPQNRYVVDYDAYVKDPQQLEGLFKFLGEPLDLPKIKEALEVRLTHK